MRQRNVRVEPIEHNTENTNIPIRQRDRNLMIIIISEVLLYVVTTALYPLILLEVMISQYIIPNKSVQYLQIESFILNIGFIFVSINSVVPFYVYLISSKSFRRDFKQLIIKYYRKLTRQATIPTPFGTNQVLTN